MPDPLPGQKSRRPARISLVVQTFRRRRPGKKPEDGGVPVGPDRPNTLSGGAAAALEFDD